jgi:signal transduction histidine kinase
VRLRLTLLYVGLFLASAACLLTITYFLVAQQLPHVQLSTYGSGSISSGGSGLMIGTGPGVAAQAGASTDSPGPVSLSTACPQPGDVPLSPADTNSCIFFLQNQVTGAQKQAVALRDDTLSKLLIESGIALGIMAIVSVGLGWLMAGRVLSPLRVITTTARRISARNLHQRIAMKGPDDELKELGDTFDQLLGRLEDSFRAQRQFVANASHELRTPLARQRTLLEVALRDGKATSETLRTACERALAAGEQHERLIGAMLTLAQSERGLDRFEPLDLGDIAEDALLTSTGDATARKLKITAAFSPAPTLGDHNLAERLVTNLIDNAIRYNTQGGQLELGTGMRHGRPFLTVSNTGLSVPSDQLSRLFQPFQRLDPGRGAQSTPPGSSGGPGGLDSLGVLGLGLGLAIVSAIAAAHGADLRARPNAAGGLTVELLFPARTGPAAPVCRELAAIP